MPSHVCRSPLTRSPQLKQSVCPCFLSIARIPRHATPCQRNWFGHVKPVIQPPGDLCKLDGALVYLHTFTCTNIVVGPWITTRRFFILDRRGERGDACRPRTFPPRKLVRKPRRWPGYLWKYWYSAVRTDASWACCCAEDGSQHKQSVCASTAAATAKF